MKKTGFTLVEVIIVITMIGLLSAILLKTYILISEISFRIQQEKNITQELLLTSQIFQNISDKNSIDFDKYNKELGDGFLEQNKGLTDILFLTGDDGQITIKSTGDCIDPGKTIDYLTGGRKCGIEINKNGKISNITDSQKIYLSTIIFKIHPYDSTYNYINIDTKCSNALICIHKSGFGILVRAYSINYGKKRYNNINIPIQQFFNTKKINEN